MSEQLTLPLEFSNTPFTVIVEVDTKRYKICTVPDEALAQSIMGSIARLLNENTGVTLTKPETMWVGVQQADKRHAMWTMFHTQREPLA
jgi:hypothetical protein